MRYWVYKDAQITGPLERDQLAESVGLRADTLVCGEDASGGREGDWRCAEEIPELSGHYHSTRGVPGADMPFEEFGLLERLQFEAVGGDPENSWLGSLFESPSPEAPRPQSSGLLAELKSSQDRVRELTDQLAGLQKKLEGIEAAGRQPKAPPAPTPFSAVSAPPPPAKEPPPPAAFKLPDLPPLPTFAPREAEAPPALPEAPPAPEAAAEAPPAEPEAPPEDDNPNRLKLSTPVKKTLQLGPAKTFKSVKKTEEPPAAIPPAPASAPPPSIAPIEAPPPMPTLAPPPMPTLAPPPAPLPTPTAPPPATLVFSTPSSQPTPGLEPPPIPGLSGATGPVTGSRPFLPPDTSPPVPPPATIPPSAAKGAPNTKEVLARLAKPQAGAAAPTKPPVAKPRSQKTLLIVSGVGIAALALIGWFILFRNPKEIKTAVSMEPETQVAEQQEAPPPVQEPAPAPAPSPAPEPQPAPVAEDPRNQAIELVRTYPLDGERGTVGQWLQFSYSASQGNTEKWDAGAVEESVYLVQYTVQSSGQKLREAITYIFEADISKGFVRAKSPLARTLMAGGSPAAPKKAAKRKPRAAARRAAAPAAAPRTLPQLPLPSDAELLPPSEDDGSFSGDTVQPGL